MINKDQPIYFFVRWRGFKEPYRQDSLSFKKAMELFKQEVETIKSMVLKEGMVNIAGLTSFTEVIKSKIFIKRYDGRKALKEIQKEAK